MNKPKLSFHLTQAAKYVEAGLYSLALNHLSAARSIVRAWGTRKGRITAAHCTAAMQALYPLVVL